jgi:hypothetical protein
MSIELAPSDDYEKKQAEDLARGRKEDFDFMVLCASKNNMAMYQLLRDKTLDDVKKEQP